MDCRVCRNCWFSAPLRNTLKGWRKAVWKLVKIQLRMSHIRGVSAALITLLAGLPFWLCFIWRSNLVNRGSSGGAGLALATLAVMASFEAVLPLPAAYQYLGRTRQAGRRLLEIVHTQPQVVFPEQSIRRRPAAGGRI